MREIIQHRNYYKWLIQDRIMERFSIDNWFSNVSLDQFRGTAHKLESAIRNIRPTIQSELLLTTNRDDYYGSGSLTVSIPKVDEAKARREKFQLTDLNENLWTRSFETELYILDNSVSEPYMICLSNGTREPKRLFFYRQCLDEASQKVFEGFRRTSILQKLGDGHSKTSNFDRAYALSNLR